jgi:hypothetical protein
MTVFVYLIDFIAVSAAFIYQICSFAASWAQKKRTANAVLPILWALFLFTKPEEITGHVSDGGATNGKRENQRVRVRMSGTWALPSHVDSYPKSDKARNLLGEFSDWRAGQATLRRKGWRAA